MVLGHIARGPYVRLPLSSVIALAVAGLVFGSATARAETLNQALASAYEYNPQLDAERARLRATDEEVTRARSGFRPVITGNADINYQYNRQRSTIPAIGTNEQEIKPKGYSIDAVQPIFSGFRVINAVNEQEANVRAGRETLRAVEQDVLLQAVTAFMDVVRDQAIVRLRENNVNVLSRELKATEDRFAVGEVTRTDVAQAQAREVPVISVNARMSDRSFKRSMRFNWALRPLAAGITRILCAAKRDEQRFKALGFPPERLQTTGNLKLDVNIPLLDDAAKAALRRELGLPPGGLVLLGSSTWPGEETALLTALKAARERGLQVSLLLVPRHAERREELRALLEKSGLGFHFRSAGAAPGPGDVAVGDTTGELRKFTQLADLVFTGKSLAPHDGGQTPVEAAVLGKPVLHGPRMTNFRDIIRSLTEAGAVRKVETHSELITAAVELLQETAQREKLAAAAREWSEANRGATGRTLAVIRAQLG